MLSRTGTQGRVLQKNPLWFETFPLRRKKQLTTDVENSGTHYHSTFFQHVAIRTVPAGDVVSRRMKPLRIET